MLRAHRFEHPRNETVIAVDGWSYLWAGLARVRIVVSNVEAVLAHLALSAMALALVAHSPAFAQASGARDQAIAPSPAQDIVWTDNQDTSACPRRPVWTIAVQGATLLLKTRNFDYQVVPIALRGDGSASMDRVFQPGRNLKYRLSGTFDGKGLMRLRLDDLAREGVPCSWRFAAEYQDGIVPGIKAVRSRNP